MDVQADADQSVVGAIGRVTVPIPADGPGEVLVPVRGGTEAFAAWSDQPIDKRLTVRDDGLLDLTLEGMQVADLSPLAGMPLGALSLENCKNVMDLSPLGQKRLHSLVRQLLRNSLFKAMPRFDGVPTKLASLERGRLRVRHPACSH